MAAEKPKSRSFGNRLLNFDIDTYLNHLVPPPPFRYLPYPISRWFGYRDASYKQEKNCNLVRWMWAFIGAFCGIALIEGVYRSSAVIQSWSPPIIIGSFGAAAILEYNTVESPLSQPRNLVFGQAISAAIGVGITKLFQLLPAERFADLQWLAGALSVATASFVMSVTKTVHPPAGATALLAATSSDIIQMGWWLLPLEVIGSLLMLGSALVLNNIQRRFPTHWWTPVDLRQARNGPSQSKDVEKEPPVRDPRWITSPPKAETRGRDDSASGKDSFRSELSSGGWSDSSEDRIVITAQEILIPEWLEVSDWSREMLELFKQRLSEHKQ